MYRTALDTAPAALLIASNLPGPVTANTYAQGSVAMWTSITQCAERTAAGPIGQIDFMPAESTAEAIMEIRRLSGLTWEELGDLFDVSRRSIHHWANGRPAAARHDQMIRRMLAAVRHLDRGDRTRTRAFLLAVDKASGVSTFDLLRHGGYDEVIARVEGSQVPEPYRIHPLPRSPGCAPPASASVFSGGRAGTAQHSNQCPSRSSQAEAQDDGLMPHAPNGRGRTGD